MEKERLAEHLERYHSGASNAATSRELDVFDTAQTRLPLEGGDGS